MKVENLIIDNYVFNYFNTMHNHKLLIIPKEIYESCDNELIMIYIKNKMDPCLTIQFYSRKEMEQKYENFKKTGNYHLESLETYINDILGYKLSANGQTCSKYNKKGFTDGYSIGGHWNGLLTKNKYSNDKIKNNSIGVNKLYDEYTSTDKCGYNILFSEDYYLTLKNHKNDYVISIDYHD